MNSQRVTIRIPPALLAEVEAELARYERTRRGPPLTMTSYILRAIERDLEHSRRSRAKVRASDTQGKFPKLAA